MWRYKGFQCYLMGDRRTCTSCTATQCPPFSVGNYFTARGQAREQKSRKPNLYPPMHWETLMSHKPDAHTPCTLP